MALSVKERGAKQSATRSNSILSTDSLPQATEPPPDITSPVPGHSRGSTAAAGITEPCQSENLTQLLSELARLDCEHERDLLDYVIDLNPSYSRSPLVRVLHTSSQQRTDFVCLKFPDFFYRQGYGPASGSFDRDKGVTNVARLRSVKEEAPEAMFIPLGINRALHLLIGFDLRARVWAITKDCLKDDESDEDDEDAEDREEVELVVPDQYDPDLDEDADFLHKDAINWPGNTNFLAMHPPLEPHTEATLTLELPSDYCPYEVEYKGSYVGSLRNLLE